MIYDYKNRFQPPRPSRASTENREQAIGNAEFQPPRPSRASTLSSGEYAKLMEISTPKALAGLDL